MIKEYRIKEGYTQEGIAEILDISTRQYQRIEANFHNTKIDMIIKIIEILKISDKDIVKMFKNNN